MVELVIQPLNRQLPRQLVADDLLPHAQDLSVVAQDASLDRIAVVCGDGSDARDLVGRDGDSETRAADQDAALGLAVFDRFGHVDGNVRVGGAVFAFEDAEIRDGEDAGVFLEVRFDGVLVLETVAIAADGDRPVVGPNHLLKSCEERTSCSFRVTRKNCVGSKRLFGVDEVVGNTRMWREEGEIMPTKRGEEEKEID